MAAPGDRAMLLVSLAMLGLLGTASGKCTCRDREALNTRGPWLALLALVVAVSGESTMYMREEYRQVKCSWSLKQCYVGFGSHCVISVAKSAFSVVFHSHHILRVIRICMLTLAVLGVGILNLYAPFRLFANISRTAP